MRRGTTTGTDRRTQRRIVRAVRRGEVLPTAAEAQAAAERAVAERTSLRRARVAFAATALVAAGGVVAGSVGPFVLLPPSLFLLGFVLVAFVHYLPRLDRSLARAERLNRAAAGRSGPG